MKQLKILSPLTLKPLTKRHKRLYSYIHFCCHKDCLGFTPIPYDELKEAVGAPDFRKYLEDLVDYIEVNEHYSTGQASTNTKAFCKSYRIKKNLFLEGYEFLTINTNLNKTAKLFVDPLLQANYLNTQQLTSRLPDDVLERISVDTYNAVLWSIRKLACGLYGTTRPSHSRIFTLFATNPKQFRHFLFRGGNHLIEVDVKTCTVLWMLSLYPRGSAEKKRMESMYNSQDIYQFIAGPDGSREQAKDELLSYVSTVESRRHLNSCHKVFSREFPEMCRLLAKDVKSNGRNYQKFESSIMIDVAFAEVVRRGLYGVVLHDCIFTDSLETAHEIDVIIKRAFQDRGLKARTSTEQLTYDNIPAPRTRKKLWKTNKRKKAQ